MAEGYGPQDVDVVSLPLPPDAATDTSLASVISKLTDVITELQGTLTVSGTVTVNTPSDFPDSTAHTKLDAIQTELGQKTEPTDTQQVSGTVSVSNQIAGFATQATLLEVVNKLTTVVTELQGTLTASVSNFPATYALPAGQVTSLTPQTDGLTDAELRATPVDVSFDAAGLALDSTLTSGAQVSSVSNMPTNFPDTTTHSKLDGLLIELQQKLENNGTVHLSASSLAALEDINATVSNFPASYPDATTHTKLDSVITELQGLDLNTDSIESILTQIKNDLGDHLTDAQLRATPLIVSDGGGSLTVDGNVTVTGTQNDALTDTELRAAPVPISDGGGSVTVDGTVGVTGVQTDALTDTQLRASPVSVSGPLTDTQLRASAVPVDTGLVTQTDALTDTELRASEVGVKDVFTAMESIAEVSGNNASQGFTFTGGAVELAWVRVDGGDGRAAVGQTPTATLGAVCEDGVPVPLTLLTSSVNVYAPSGTTINVWGFRR